MGTIRNRLTIVHDFDLDRITEMRKDAVRYFEKIVEDDSYMEYDVDSQMVSPILKSVVNQEYTFVIMGDCSKLGWDTSEKYEQYRNEWIKKNKGVCQHILVADFGEDEEAFITEY